MPRKKEGNHSEPSAIERRACDAALNNLMAVLRPLVGDALDGIMIVVQLKARKNPTTTSAARPYILMANGERNYEL